MPVICYYPEEECLFKVEDFFQAGSRRHAFRHESRTWTRVVHARNSLGATRVVPACSADLKKAFLLRVYIHKLYHPFPIRSR
jgi:hypothetical protein